MSAGARCRAGAGYEVSDLGRVRSVPRILSDGVALAGYQTLNANG